MLPSLLTKNKLDRLQKSLVLQSGQGITGLTCPPKCKKVDTNGYTTTMKGIKYKLADTRAEQEIAILANLYKRNDQYRYWKD